MVEVAWAVRKRSDQHIYGVVVRIRLLSVVPMVISHSF
jgi:hypothetical protein